MSLRDVSRFLLHLPTPWVRVSQAAQPAVRLDTLPQPWKIGVHTTPDLQDCSNPVLLCLTDSGACFVMVVPGSEPSAFCTLGKHCTSMVYPYPCLFLLEVKGVCLYKIVCLLPVKHEFTFQFQRSLKNGSQHSHFNIKTLKQIYGNYLDDENRKVSAVLRFE